MDNEALLEIQERWQMDVEACCERSSGTRWSRIDYDARRRRMNGYSDAGAELNIKRGRGPVGPVWERSATRVCGTHTHPGRLCLLWSISKEASAASGHTKCGRITCL